MAETTSSPAPVSRPPEPPGSFVVGLLRDWAVAVVVVVILLIGYNFLFRPAPPALGPAPDFSLADLEGRSVQLSKVEGVVILNFWFTTCPPCRAEIPELTAFAQEHPNVSLYGVSTDLGMPTARLAAESKRLGVEYTVLHDRRGEVAQLYGVDTFPTTLVVVDGEIKQARIGRVNRSTLEQMVAAAD